MNRTVHEVVVRDTHTSKQKCYLRSRIDDPNRTPGQERDFLYQEAQMSYTASDELLQLIECNENALCRVIGERWLKERDYDLG